MYAYPVRNVADFPTTIKECPDHGQTAFEIRHGEGVNAYICIKCRQEALFNQQERE